jgi:rRNA-processing protein FCF1
MICMDANALMMPVEADIRVFEELDRVLADGETAGTVEADPAFAVPRAVLGELERLAGGAGEAATAAGVGLDLARERCRVLDHDATNGDAAVFECGTRETVTHVATNDGPLRDRLLDAGVPVISLRAKHKLAVNQP